MDEAVATLSVWDCVGELALRRKIAGNVAVIRSIVVKPRCAFPWIEYDDGFLEVLADNAHGRDEVCIPAHKNEYVRFDVESIKEHGGGDVHVRALLFELHDLYQAALCRGANLALRFMHGHQHGILAVEPLYNLDIRKSGQSLHIDFLAIKRGAVVRICLHGRSEVLDRNEFVVIA